MLEEVLAGGREEDGGGGWATVTEPSHQQKSTDPRHFLGPSQPALPPTHTRRGEI